MGCGREPDGAKRLQLSVRGEKCHRVDSVGESLALAGFGQLHAAKNQAVGLGQHGVFYFTNTNTGAAFQAIFARTARQHQSLGT